MVKGQKIQNPDDFSKILAQAMKNPKWIHMPISPEIPLFVHIVQSNGVPNNLECFMQ